MDRRRRIVSIHLDDRSLPVRSPQAEHERRSAVFDLIEDNAFALVGGPEGPYALHLRQERARLVFDVRTPAGRPLAALTLALPPLRGLIRDYFVLCDNYFRAIKTLSPSQIEAIDLGRRSLHNEGADALRTRLAGKAAFDDTTARRLFTLVCALHFRG